MLTPQQAAQLKAVIAQEGGWDGFREAAFAALAQDRKDAALAALASAISVNVTDWTALGAFIQANKDNAALMPVLADIKAAAAARDASKLGPLMVALYAACVRHFGI